MFSSPIGTKSTLPIIRLMKPANPIIPKPGILISRIRSPTPIIMRKIAPTLILNPVPINPSTIAMIPKTSTPDPRLEIPKMIP